MSNGDGNNGDGNNGENDGSVVGALNGGDLSGLFGANYGSVTSDANIAAIVGFSETGLSVDGNNDSLNSPESTTNTQADTQADTEANTEAEVISDEQAQINSHFAVFNSIQKGQAETESLADTTSKVVQFVVDTFVSLVLIALSPIAAILGRGAQTVAGTTLGQQAGKAVSSVITGNNYGLAKGGQISQDTSQIGGGIKK